MPNKSIETGINHQRALLQECQNTVLLVQSQLYLRSE